MKNSCLFEMEVDVGIHQRIATDLQLFLVLELLRGRFVIRLRQ